MKYVRFLIPLVLLCVAAPAFAICGLCEDNTCTWNPGQYTRCYYKHFLCYSECREEYAAGCSGSGFAATESFDTQYRIVSVKVEEVKASPIKHETPAAIPAKSMKKTT